MNIIKIATLAICFCCLTSVSNADLIINLSGTVGSNVVNYVASGSVTVGSATAATSSSVGRAPEGGSWDSGFDNNLGDLIQTGNASSLNSALSSFISYRRNGVEFGEIEAFDIGATDTAGGDDFQIDMNGTVSYPELVNGDIISWVGSGTFTLASGNYDNYFETGGVSGSSVIDGGNFVVNIAAATAIPEPGALGVLALGGICLLRRRRR